MIGRCTDEDFLAIHGIVNGAALAYKGVIPDDRWHEPYMPEEELRREIAAGVAFFGYRENGDLIGVMGIQDMREVALIRHAYVRLSDQRRGVGGALLAEVRRKTGRALLVGTWAAAHWAIGFYRKHGFRLLESEEKVRLLRAYWSIPERQIESSVVLAEESWVEDRR